MVNNLKPDMHPCGALPGASKLLERGRSWELEISDYADSATLQQWGFYSALLPVAVPIVGYDLYGRML